jgi:hypothetical protein
MAKNTDNSREFGTIEAPPEVPAIQAQTNVRVLICSKLPTSIILNHPLSPEVKVTVRGLNAAQRGTNGQPISVPFITTEIDKEFWDAWEAAHGEKARKPFPAIKSGALYAAKSASHAQGIAKEQESRLTGLQGMNQNVDPRMGKRAQDQVARDRD